MQQTTTTKSPQTQLRMGGSSCITFAVLYKGKEMIDLIGE
jgi:hypothetical protein